MLEVMLKKFLTNNWLMVGIAFSLLVAGTIMSLSCHNFQWLSRFGALVICIGVITLARPSILGVDIKSHVIMADTGLSHLDAEHWKKIGEPLPPYVLEDINSRTAAGWLGPLMCFVGTATNGFADLLNKLVGYT
jgi:hypothetical protein